MPKLWAEMLASHMAEPSRPRRRPRHPMPPDVARILKTRGLLAAYRKRPAYQQNDYLGWIGRAVRAETRRKRLDLMLAELAAGEGYMKMAWRPQKAKKPRQAALRRG